MKEIYVVAAKRSPIGSYLGALSTVSLVELGTQTLTKTLQAYEINPQIIDQVILGNVLSAGNGQGPARQMALNSKISEHVPAYGLNMICGSGLKTVINAYAAIQSGLNHIIAVVGAESMSTAAFVLPGKLRSGQKMGDFTVVDTMVNDALTDAFTPIHMGNTAENVAAKLTLSRLMQDEYALNSHKKAVAAIKNSSFKSEIVPINFKTKKGEITFSEDESPRPNLEMAQLQKLKPAFQKDGTVTAGNASSLNDGAAALVIVDQDALNLHHLTPLVKIIGIGEAGIDPKIMGLGPVNAVERALKHANLTLDQIEILELNEAFAAQSLGVIQLLAQQHQISEAELLAKTNLNGGAIALGHPVGCSGARILVTLINLLLTKQKKYGLAALCIGGGMGVCVIVENTKLTKT